MPFDLGDTVRLTAQCRDAAGTLTTATSAALTITLPDGTTATPTVSAPAVAGEYRHDYVTAAAGRHAVRWVFTGPAAAYTDVFDVRPGEPPLILSLVDAKRHLQISSTAHDDQLREWLETITEGVENFTGIGPRRTVTEDHDVPVSGARGLALRRTPVLALVSAVGVLTGGSSYEVAALDVDGSTGIVRHRAGSRLYGPLRVTYTAGRAVIPASITSAARIILQHLWRTQYGASRASGSLGGGDDFAVTEPVPGLGYAIPNRALQLMEPYRLPPGVA